jgi:hypothetical protein
VDSARIVHHIPRNAEERGIVNPRSIYPVNAIDRPHHELAAAGVFGPALKRDEKL